MKLRIVFVWLLAAGFGFAAAFVWSSHRAATRYARELEVHRAAWDVERAALQEAADEARNASSLGASVVMPGAVVPVVKLADPQELLNRLVALKSVAGPGQARVLREVLGLLGQLTDAGAAALPVIRDFLVTGQDAVYAAGGKSPRDVKALVDSLVPATLRFGLFDVVHQIGGEEAEKILAEILGRTGRGAEVAYLTQLLEELFPGQYRDAALAAARALLASTTGGDRDYLFAVLKRFGDDSYVSTAQAQLVQMDGKVDRSALRYLQDTLGDKSIALVAQAYKDARVTEADSKESLARVALAYVGATDQAVELFHTAVLDQSLKPDHRRELVEDLNQDGLSSKKNWSAADLDIIAKRYELTQAYLKQDYVQNDKLLNAAFHEADKDLANMLQRAAAGNLAK